MRRGNKERKITDIGWENKEQKMRGMKMRGMKMRIITCFGARTISRG